MSSCFCLYLLRRSQTHFYMQTPIRPFLYALGDQTISNVPVSPHLFLGKTILKLVRLTVNYNTSFFSHKSTLPCKQLWTFSGLKVEIVHGINQRLFHAAIFIKPLCPEYKIHALSSNILCIWIDHWVNN